MLTFYIAVILNASGDIDRVLSNEIYNKPEACYALTQFPTDEGTNEKYKCMKVTGDFVNFKLVEVKE